MTIASLGRYTSSSRTPGKKSSRGTASSAAATRAERTCPSARKVATSARRKNPLSALSSHTFRAYMVAGGIGTVLTAGYFLWMLQRVNLGKVPAQWEGKKLVDVQPLEMLAWAPLLLLTLGLGLFPRLIFDVTTHSVIGLTKLLGG